MEEKVTNLNEWAVEDVVREIEKNIARKFEEQKFDGKALIFLSKEGSVPQLDVCGLKTVGDQMRLKEFVSESQDLAVDIPVGRRTSKPSLMNIKQCSEMNQSIYKAKRKAIRAAVIKIWPGNEIPTFKSNSEAEEKLNTLVKDLEKECTFAPLDFGKEGIRQHTLDVLNERRRHVRKGRDYFLPDKRTLKRKLKSNHASPTVIITSGGENSGNSSSVSSDQSSDTFPFYSSEEEDSAMSVVTHPKQQVHEKELQPDREKSCDKLPLTPDHENETTHGEATEEGGGLAATTAQIIICVAFNAIQISDVP